MDKSGRRALSENIARFVQRSGLSRLAWAQANKLDVKAVERVEKDMHGEKGVGLSYVDTLARQLRLEPWQLLVPDLDLNAPPALQTGEQPRRLTGGGAALLLAQAFSGVADRPRHHAANLISEMIDNGPDESQASAIDALATVDVSLQLSPPPAASPLGVELLDLDQEVAATLKELAVASKTMTSTQRAAMVAALRGIKEKSWDTTGDSLRRFMDKVRQMDWNQKTPPASKRAGKS